MTTTIPQRTLRNDVADVLRRAELGERFTITVGGRPVAELGPTPRRTRLAEAEVFSEILALGVDDEWQADLAALRDQEADPT